MIFDIKLTIARGLRRPTGCGGPRCQKEAETMLKKRQQRSPQAPQPRPARPDPRVHRSTHPQPNRPAAKRQPADTPASTKTKWVFGVANGARHGAGVDTYNVISLGVSKLFEGRVRCAPAFGLIRFVNKSRGGSLDHPVALRPLQLSFNQTHATMADIKNTA
jgi:hypothetical protein